MSWGFLDPTRFLKKKTWNNASELARELYSMATDGTTAKVERPLELKQSGPEPALKIVGSPYASPHSSAESAHPRQNLPARAIDVQPTRAADPQPFRPGTAVGNTVKAAEGVVDLARAAAGRLGGVIERQFVENVVGEASQYAASRFIESVGAATKPTPPTRLPQPPDIPVRSSPEAVAVRAEEPSRPRPNYSPGQQNYQSTNTKVVNDPHTSPANEVAAIDPGLSLPHRSPVVDVDGPVSFRGNAPVQFDTVPHVLDSETGEYAPLDIPRQLQQYIPPWLTPNMQVGFVQSMTAADYSSSSPVPGTGEVQFYDVATDASLLTVEDGSQTTTCHSFLQFAWSGCWALGVQFGENWFFWPLGPVCVATGTIPANSSNDCTLTAAYGGTTAKIYNAGSVAIQSAGAGPVTIWASIDFNGKLQAINNSCT